MLDHVDVGQDEAGFGRSWVQAALEGADEAQVGVGGDADGGVGEAVVVQGVGGGVGHKGWNVESGVVSRGRIGTVGKLTEPQS